MVEVLIFLFWIPVIYLVISLIFRFFTHLSGFLRDVSASGCLMMLVAVATTIAIVIGVSHLASRLDDEADHRDYSVPDRHRTR